MKPTLTRKQLEEMLPDYAFGRLGAEDSLQFEQSIEEYPDLNQELRDIQSVFSKVEKMDFNSILENRTRNISVRVQQRLASKNSQSSSFSRLFRFVIPTAALAAMAYFVFTSDSPFFNSSKNNLNVVSNEHHVEVVHSSDAVSLLSGDVNPSAVLAEARTHQNNSEINITLQDNIALDELIADNILPASEEFPTSEPTEQDEIWNNLTDNEIQDILKDLSYETTIL